MDSQNYITVHLAGNPNVGKSTIFNTLTGMHQHTGNWTGKTVSGAIGYYQYENKTYRIVDTPGTYSLQPFSPEEEITRNILAFDEKDVVVVVCDATAPKRGFYFLLQIMELCPRVILCMNLTDQAKKQGVQINYQNLSKHLGIPVIATSSKKKKGYNTLKNTIANTEANNQTILTTYPQPIEQEIQNLTQQIVTQKPTSISPRYLAVKLLEQDRLFIEQCIQRNVIDLQNIDIESAFKMLQIKGYTKEQVAKSITQKYQDIALFLNNQYVTKTKQPKQYLADKLLTNPLGSLLTFSALLFLVFWITIYVAQYPSAMLQNLLFSLESPITNLLNTCRLPSFIVHLITKGIYRTTAFVISVMLPPMAIFFPLFTLLEDLGLLPRIAMNLDHTFSKCNSCGKQALTMCMGLGCNATGVTGCRIIHSPKERAIAVITNALVPCNGKFPTIITLLTLFFSYSLFHQNATIVVAMELTALILLTIVVTFIISWCLSKTLSNASPTFFSLELPSYRIPQIGQVVVRSIFDRTLFVLGRSISVAAPAGLIIWCLGTLTVHDLPLFTILANTLDPIGHFFGLDGTILLAFILGMPANEIILPIMIMIYTSKGILTEFSLQNVLEIFHNNHWTMQTALCVLFFMLFHTPCTTTLLTVYKETKSKKYTLLSFLIPTTVGLIGCLCIRLLFYIFS